MSETAPYVVLDTIPEIAAERQSVREHAWALMAQRKELYDTGYHEALPLPQDALSTADAVLSARTNFGQHSAEYRERLAGLRLDCSRLVGEWYRKKRPEYFAPTRHYFDDESNDYYSHGLSIRQMTENALRPIIDDPEEEARRVNERVEDDTPRILRKLGTIGLVGAGIRTISECTDKAIADYESDLLSGNAHRGYGGYVPEIKKVMIRDMRLDLETNDRLQEQIGLPGTYLTHWVIQETLRRRGAETDGLDKTALHGTQLLVHDDLMEFAAALDEVASEQWCVPVFMGEAVAPEHPRDYRMFRQEALARQEELREISEKVATFVLNLAEDGFDRRQAPAHVEEFVKMLLLDMSRRDYGLAADIFDEHTARGLQKVYELESFGQHEEAYRYMQKVLVEAPGGGFCSGGSCGLESVFLSGAEGAELLKNLRAEAGDTIVRDKERACRCGAKKIVYAYSARKVNKYCESCHAFESKSS